MDMRGGVAMMQVVQQSAGESFQWAQAFEDECQGKVRALVALPQASADKKRAFSQLLSLILAQLDRFTRRSWLPEDEATAMAIVELLLAAGTDPAMRNRAGRTAADWARKRGMTAVARRRVVRR